MIDQNICEKDSISERIEHQIEVYILMNKAFMKPLACLTKERGEV